VGACTFVIVVHMCMFVCACVCVCVCVCFYACACAYVCMREVGRGRMFETRLWHLDISFVDVSTTLYSFQFAAVRCIVLQ